MGEVEGEIDGCLPDLLLHVGALPYDFPDDVHHFCPQGHRLDVSEEGRQGFLEELQDSDVVLQNRVFQAFEHQLQEHAHRNLGR